MTQYIGQSTSDLVQSISIDIDWTKSKCNTIDNIYIEQFKNILQSIKLKKANKYPYINKTNHNL